MKKWIIMITLVALSWSAGAQSSFPTKVDYAVVYSDNLDTDKTMIVRIFSQGGIKLRMESQPLWETESPPITIIRLDKNVGSYETVLEANELRIERQDDKLFEIPEGYTRLSS